MTQALKRSMTQRPTKFAAGVIVNLGGLVAMLAQF